jgi:hypothetical protein
MLKTQPDHTLPWYGVDLDGTLAEDDGAGVHSIGKPVRHMVKRVKEMLAKDLRVRIVTARVQPVPGTEATEAFCAHQRKMIEDWCRLILGVVLPVQANKDFLMVLLYDDRAVPIVQNTGMTPKEFQDAQPYRHKVG